MGFKKICFICRQWEDIVKLYSESEKGRHVFYNDQTLETMYILYIYNQRPDTEGLLQFKLDLQRDGQDEVERLAHYE